MLQLSSSLIAGRRLDAAAGDREPLALDADRKSVYDMRTFVVDERVCEDDVDKVIRYDDLDKGSASLQRI